MRTKSQQGRIAKIEARAFAAYTTATAFLMGGNTQAAIPLLEELRDLMNQLKKETRNAY